MIENKGERKREKGGGGVWKEGSGRLSSRRSKYSSDWGQIDVTMVTTDRQERKNRGWWKEKEESGKS